LTRDAAAYFLPAIISSALLVLIALVSHLTRGCPLDWFWREDVRPAYRSVTWIWTLFFTMRLVIQISLYQRGATGTLAWVNTLLGWPVTIAVLIISYVYGIWCLHQLNGPGVHEYKTGKEPPWEGQARGF